MANTSTTSTATVTLDGVIVHVCVTTSWLDEPDIEVDVEVDVQIDVGFDDDNDDEDEVLADEDVEPIDGRVGGWPES